MSHHDLKEFTEHFQPVVDGIRRSTVRFNDRDYQVGDTVTLHDGQTELDGFQYTGKTVSAMITYIDSFGLKDGYVNLSLGRVGLTIIQPW